MSQQPALFPLLDSCDPRAMSIVPHTIPRPFGVNTSNRYHRRHALRVSSVKATTGKEPPGSKKQAARLEVLYDDGFGAVTMKDYFEAVRVMTKQDDGGPPRWFCPVECGRPQVEKPPLLLFLPGTDGVGMELILHHQSLGRVFEVCCFHIPVNDRTPFEGLLQIVEGYVKNENALSPNRPIYITGDSFGGCLAISVAARNPEIDLVLTLINPATSSAKNSLLAILPSLESVPSNLPVIHPHLLRYLIGNPINMAMVSVQNNLSPQKTLQELSDSLTSMLPLVLEPGAIIRMDTLVWKLKLLKSGAAYANSQLHAVQAEVLLLASGSENLPPKGEADRLFKTMKNCKVRYFRNRGEILLMEDGFNLLTVIKGANMYRRSRQWDSVTDFLPPTISEFKRTFGEDFKLFHQLLSPVMLSTMRNGKIVRGLAGVPKEGPVLFVGYHQLLAMELSSLVEGFLRERKTIVRTVAHPVYFAGNYETLRQELSLFDLVSMYGAAPVSPINMYKLFKRNEFVLLYPGGVREALHRKGEAYKLFWPDQPEFVRMAARFGVTIIPFGCVGEDDFLEIILDYNDEKNIPYLRDGIKSFNEDFTGIRVFRYSVEQIDLSGNIAVDAEWLAYLGAFRYLRVLKMADCKNVNSAAVWALSGMGTLKELDLSRCSRMSDAGIKHIVSIDCLEKLHLSDTGLTDSGVILISALKNLQLLDLGGIHMTDKAFRSLQVLTKLEHLDIWGSEITNEGASILKAFTRLRFLNVSWTHVTRLPPLPNMRCLNMSNCTIHSIRSEDSEVHIPLEKFTASAASFGNIDEVISSIEASSFSFLDMSGCSISNLYILQKLKSLEHLDLSFSRITDDEIQYVANIGMNLRYLSLKNTGITSQAPCILAGTVPNLSSLSLAHTKIDDSALVYISMMPSLRVLDLSHTSIKGFTRVEANSEKTLSMPALECLIYLESLYLEDTTLSDEVIPPLASFKALKYLYLKSDFLFDPALHALSSASNLIHLGFCGNVLSNSGLVQFVPPTHLRVLDLSGCWILTEDAIATFCRHHPIIEVRHELMQELQKNRGGTSQVHKSRQHLQIKAKAVNISADASRLSGISFVDERIKYSRGELMNIQDRTGSNLVVHGVRLPPELRRME